MEEVLGPHIDQVHFVAFLAKWQSILAQRAGEAIDRITRVEGVKGLVLAGSVGRGTPWPLSDIDFLPVYDDDRFAIAQAAVEKTRIQLLAGWADQGWRTGVDIGRLAFGYNELAQVFAQNNPDILPLLNDDRWYHSIDKGYQGRAVYDPGGLTTQLITWLTASRFSTQVIERRIARADREISQALQDLRCATAEHDARATTLAVRAAVKWIQIRLLETWGERDNSFGRIGTRFERCANARSLQHVVAALNELSDLDDASVSVRMLSAPLWVNEWHHTTLQARQLINEDVSPIQNARDALRVCSYYEIRAHPLPPYPEWLAIKHRPDGYIRLAALLQSLSVAHNTTR